jgi:hypothetical protein
MDSIHGEIRQLEHKFKDDIFKTLRVNKLMQPFMKWDIDLSSEEEDCNLSYDMVFMGRVELSVRIRKNEYLRYKDFTIRSRSKNGFKCEIDKLIEGLGSIYFYGWMDEAEQGLEHWIVVDINKIRDKLLTNGSERSNADGTKFRAYSINFLRENFALIGEKDQMKLF